MVIFDIMKEIMAYFILVILGLAVGSFLNVVIYRLPRDLDFAKGRSFCPHCRHSLGASDLIPLLSFIMLRGRCRYCRKPISWQYPLVEILTALIFVVIYLRFGLSANFFVYLINSLFLLVIFMIDLKNYLILDSITLPAIVLAFIFNLLIVKSALSAMVIAGIIGGGFFLLQFLLSQGKWIGGGDIRLGFLIGIMLADWEKLIVALFFAYLVGAIFGIILMVSGKKSLKSKIPLGTFLSLATLVVLLWGETILNWYWTRIL